MIKIERRRDGIDTTVLLSPVYTTTVSSYKIQGKIFWLIWQCISINLVWQIRISAFNFVSVVKPQKLGESRWWANKAHPLRAHINNPQSVRHGNRRHQARDAYSFSHLGVSRPATSATHHVARITTAPGIRKKMTNNAKYRTSQT